MTTLTALDRGNLTKAEARLVDPTVATCAKCRWWKKSVNPERLASAAHRHVSRCKGEA